MPTLTNGGMSPFRPDETLDTWAGISGICVALMVLLLVITEQRRRQHRRHQAEQARRVVKRARTEHLINRIAHAAADPIDRELMHLSGQCTGQCEQPYDQEQTP